MNYQTISKKIFLKIKLLLSESQRSEKTSSYERLRLTGLCSDESNKMKLKKYHEKKANMVTARSTLAISYMIHLGPITSAVMSKLQYSNLCIRFSIQEECCINLSLLQCCIMRHCLLNQMLSAITNQMNKQIKKMSVLLVKVKTKVTVNLKNSKKCANKTAGSQN